MKTLSRSILFVRLFLLTVALSAHAQTGLVFTTLHSFTGTNDGANPQAALTLGSDGYLYGTTYQGGSNGWNDGGYFLRPYGTVFKINANGVFTTLYSFGSTQDVNRGALDGARPEAALAQGTDGYLYGTTTGGINENLQALNGTVFKITTNGILATLHTFGGENLDGYDPQGGLTLGRDGNFYGTTYDTIFTINTNGALTTLDGMDSFYSGIYLGFEPRGALVQGYDGNFYGTTYQGGIGYDPNREYNTAYGTVFKVITDTNDQVRHQTNFYTFPGWSGGGCPVAGLILGNDGNFYGTTEGGGPANAGDGTIFKITTNLVLTTLYDFGTNGSQPYAGLVQGSDGSLYGTTLFGATNFTGSIFKINPDGTGFTTLHTFMTGAVSQVSGLTTNCDGASPRGNLILVSNTLYGTTSSGGVYGYGTVFSLTLPGPQLSLTTSGNNIALSWPTNTPNLTLQFTTNLIPPATWTTYSTTPLVINGQNVVSNPTTGSQMFFRLSP